MNLASYSFQRNYWAEVLVVEDKIVYFGTSIKGGTFVLENEGASEQLKVVRKDCRFNLERGSWNTASRVVKNEIYAFRNGEY